MDVLAVMTAGLLSLQIVATGLYPGGVRRKVFGKSWAKSAAASQVAEEHKKATGEDLLPRGGYPDMGNGRFAATLSYADWYAFNNAQRAHYNYVEHAASTLALTILAGLFFPRFASIAGLGVFVGRLLYSNGYAKNGPSGRGVGATIVDTALIVLFGATMWGGAEFAGLTGPVKALVGF